MNNGPSSGLTNGEGLLTMIDLKLIPAMPQSQISVSEQLQQLRAVGNKLGLCDAVDALQAAFGDSLDKLDALPYGCYCDLEEGQEPDGCVIDEGEPHKCIYASKIERKEQCQYWNIIAKG